MSYETGTATNHTDFMAKLETFALAQGWTKEWEVSNALDRQFVLKGPGVVGGEPVYVAFRLRFNTVTSIYDVFMRGLIGVVPTATLTDEHIGVSPEVAFMLDENPMTYWFVINDRRLVVIAKISTVFESAYAGFFLPYGTPVNFPRPYFIAGTRGRISQNALTWRSSDNAHSAGICRPHAGQWETGALPNAYMLNPFGEWNCFLNEGNDTNLSGRLNYTLPRKGPELDNMNTMFSKSMIGYERFSAQITHNIDGGYSLAPLTLVSATPTINTWGILQDVFWVPGFDNAAENTITLPDGRQFLVVQDTFRTDHSSYFAILLG